MSNPAFKEADEGRSSLSMQRPAPRFGRIDPDAIARAEAALKGLSSQFGQWLNDEVEKLEAARGAVHALGLTQATSGQLYTHAHDLKGLGTTYEFPIITRLAGSLCRLLREGEARSTTPMALLDRHVDAISTCLRDDVRDVDSPAGKALVDDLDREVGAYLRLEA